MRFWPSRPSFRARRGACWRAGFLQVKPLSLYPHSEVHMWNQFRRLLLGTVADILLEEKIPMDFSTFEIHFDPDSVFKVPRLDNYMRFKGSFSVSIDSTLPPDRLARIEQKLSGAWRELVGVLDIPIGDRLTLESDLIRARNEGSKLVATFDLSAD